MHTKDSYAHGRIQLKNHLLVQTKDFNLLFFQLHVQLVTFMH